MSTRETKLTSNICNNHFKTALRSNNDEVNLIFNKFK